MSDYTRPCNCHWPTSCGPNLLCPHHGNKHHMAANIAELERKLEMYKEHLAKADDYIDELQRQLAERRTVTKKMRENAKHYWQTHGLAKMTMDLFIDGMLTAALEAGEDE